MPRPGPKPVEMKQLKTEAMNWAMVLFALRDGQDGLLLRNEWGKWGPWRRPSAAKIHPQILKQMKGTPWEGVPPAKTKRKTQTGRILSARIVAFDDKEAKFLSKLKMESDFTFFPPIPPSRDAWEQLKQARTVVECRRALHSLGRYLKRSWQGWYGGEFPHALERYAQELLTSKRLFNYPKSERRRSDDKRVIFFAKVLAGARFNLAPTYATKKLRKWRWPKDWVERPYKEFTARVRSQTGGIQ